MGEKVPRPADWVTRRVAATLTPVFRGREQGAKGKVEREGVKDKEENKVEKGGVSEPAGREGREEEEGWKTVVVVMVAVSGGRWCVMVGVVVGSGGGDGQS